MNSGKDEEKLQRPRCTPTNQVKLHPSNEHPRHGYASFSLATIENGCCVSARIVYYLTKKCFALLFWNPGCQPLWLGRGLIITQVASF